MKPALLLLPLLLAPSAFGALDWRELPPLPEPLGVAGPFVAVEKETLIVAGGANFETSPFQGGTKRWIDRAFALEPGAASWRELDPLPYPLGYGASVQTPGGALWIGGSEAQRHHANVLRVRYEQGTLSFAQLPALPAPCANHGAALLGTAVYVVCGQASPGSTQAEKRFWRAALADLENPVTLPVWQELEPWPGPARILPVVVAQDGALFLFSGAELTPDGRRVLTDGYRFIPGRGWREVAGPPTPLVAASAVARGPGHILVFGGDDGSLFNRNDSLGDDHPGFPRSVWAYHAITDTWTRHADAPFGHVTTTAASWQGGVVVPSGEDRPGHRSPRVFLGAPGPVQTGFSTLDYAALVLYLLALVAIGVYFSRRESTTGDFFLAGRRIPWWAAGLSIYGTQLSSISFIAIPAKVFATDWVYLLVQLSIVLVAFPTAWLYLPFFRRLNVTTAYEYLEARFNVAVRLFASASFILFQVGRMAIVLFLPAIALTTVTGIDVFVCILAMGVLATIYTALGGVEAVIWTDVLQVFVLLGGALLSLVLILGRLDGGLGELIESGAGAGKFHVFNWDWDYTTTAVWVVLIGNFFNNLVPYTSDQAVVQRYLTTPDEASARKSIFVNAAMLIPSTLILFTLGTALWAFYGMRPELLNPELPADAVFPLFISQQLPTGLAGLVVAGVFAASMSTLDSSLNSVAAAITTDFYGRFKPNVADASKLRLARWLTVVFGTLATGVAMALAASNVGSLWDAFQATMGLFGGALAGLFALGIFTRRANGAGALVGALASVAVLAWVQQNSPAHFFLYGMIGVLTCVAVGYLSSLVLPGDKRDLAGLTLYRMQRRR